MTKSFTCSTSGGSAYTMNETNRPKNNKITPIAANKRGILIRSKPSTIGRSADIRINEINNITNTLRTVQITYSNNSTARVKNIVRAVISTRYIWFLACSIVSIVAVIIDKVKLVLKSGT